MERAKTDFAQTFVQAEAVFDTNRRFVRITGEHPNGFIEFDFAVGEPELFVEMILRHEDFAEFCAENAVEMLAPETAAAGEGTPDDWNWRLADATQTRFR